MVHVSFSANQGGKFHVYTSRNGFPRQHIGAIHKGMSGRYYLALKDHPGATDFRTLQQAKSYAKELYQS